MDYKKSSAWKVVIFCFIISGIYGGVAQALSSDAQISITAVVPSASSGGGGSSSGNSGGGGGGGGSFGLPGNQVIFKGLAYPGSPVTLLRSSSIAGQVTAGPDGMFEIVMSSLSPGSYNFSLRSEDMNGQRSALQTYSIMLTTGIATTVSGIFLPPTISISKNQVRRGDVITFFGTAAPNAKVTTITHSATEIVKTVNADLLGRWLYKFDTLPLENGLHKVRARAASAYDISPFSKAISFRVGAGPAPSPILADIDLGRFDINGDRRVNIKDFSILAYWFRRPAPPRKADFNGDGKVDLTDFSILAYHWTG